MDYDQLLLCEMARDAVKPDNGTLTKWCIRVNNGDTSLVVSYDVFRSTGYEHKEVNVAL